MIREWFKNLWDWLWGIPWDLSFEEREERILREVEQLREIHKARFRQ